SARPPQGVVPKSSLPRPARVASTAPLHTITGMRIRPWVSPGSGVPPFQINFGGQEGAPLATLATTSVQAATDAAHAALDEGLSDAAWEQVQIALAQDPEFLPALELAAKVCWGRGDRTGAEAFCQRAMNHDPKSPDFYFHYSAILRSVGKWNEAITICQ